MNRENNRTNDLNESLSKHLYLWPEKPLLEQPGWRLESLSGYQVNELSESKESLKLDSRWPAFFPCPMSIVTTGDGVQTAMEREVGASIVNRFPYVVAISLCRDDLSERHHARTRFMELLESSGVATLQFLPPGEALSSALATISEIPDSGCHARIKHSGLVVRQAITNQAPVLAPAYMVYEGRLVRPQRDFNGDPVYAQPWKDVGSHRVYFIEITAIQLREDIARGNSQIQWRALPAWQPSFIPLAHHRSSSATTGRYQKDYKPNYTFPATSTIAFEWDEIRDGMAVMHVPALPEDQVEVDNDRARWPCFFPSSCGLITTWDEQGFPNIMPCGSTTVISRQPLVVAPCVSYAKINDRYATRKTLSIIRKSGRFGCSVPYINDVVINGLKYAGNNSLADDRMKVFHTGFSISHSDYGPVIKEAPVHFDCLVTGEVKLGTHVMFLGEVQRILVRPDVTPENPLEWCPWPAVVKSGIMAQAHSAS